MAFEVAFDGTRINAADATTNWAADSATPTLDSDAFYQGTGSIAFQVKTSDTGVKFASSSTNMTDSAWLVKYQTTRPASLDGNGASVRLGSSDAANYYVWSLFNASTYPGIGGWVIVLLNPNVSEWRLSTSGSPNLGAVIYWGFRGDQSASANRVNTFADAIDIIPLGKGLTGTGSSPSGKFADFVSADEGTVSNRWGVVQSRDGIVFVNGLLTIGSAGTATGFASTNEVLVFPAHLVTTGNVGLVFDLQNAGTNISLVSAVVNGRGALSAGGNDTRPRLTVNGTSGVATFTGCSFVGLEQAILRSVVTMTECTFTRCGLITPNGATMLDCSVLESTVATNTSALVWNEATNPDGKLDGMTFTKGANAHHAIELGTSSPTEVTLRNMSFTGFSASNGQNDSVIHVKRTSGNVTIFAVNASGTVSYKSDGANVTVITDMRTLTLTGIKVGSEVRIFRVSDDVELAGAESEDDGTFTYTYQYTADTPVYIHIHHLDYLFLRIETTLVNADASIPVQQTRDRQYANP
jgi:hypothetical protein